MLGRPKGNCPNCSRDPALITGTLRDASAEPVRCQIVKVRRHKIEPGDRVVFWLSGKNAGVIALGEITDLPVTGQLNEEYILTDNHPDWDPFVPFDLFLDLYDQPIARADLKMDPQFAGESIIVQPFAANAHRVSADPFLAILGNHSGGVARRARLSIT